ncbi:YiiX/YebB-like N1pC/P60 family cysteine hydrolase [Bdellovibrio sp. HCB2-146]|uniref:YiiX/YebB-like N1pC/P60 family cysteine hydrolase n=1 Tax=Bdellovibrio sp. HCB2-146 TaxID=3394362 RepID=UPI0039BC2ABF
MKKSVLVSLCLAAITACQSPTKPTPEATTFRKPASADELIEGSRKVLADLSNPQIFNPGTCATFVNGLTDYLYRLPADHFVPKTPQEIEKFKAEGVQIVDTIFQIRVTLRERMQEFDSRNELPAACIQKVREGIQYARYAEEYVLEWLYQNKVLEFVEKPILTNEKPNTWTNSRFAGFTLKTGDAMLIRGKSHVSAMIARIGDEEGNFSHLAIIGENSKGEKYVVESLIQKGVIVTPLEKWRQDKDARVALYRQPDEELGRKAGRKIYEIAKAALDKGAAIRYDFAMNDDDYSALFCSEVIRMAYDKATDGQYIIPKYRSGATKFKGTDYLKSLGVLKDSLFAPYDMEVDPRFDFVAEFRYYPLLRQVRMQDAVLQSVYDWMIQKKYKYTASLGQTSKAYLAKFLRQFGVLEDTLPKYMPMNSIKTNVQFEAVAKVLEKNIYEKEQIFYKEKGYLPTFTDMLAFNEDFRRFDCKRYEAYEELKRKHLPFMPPPRDLSQIHWFFSPEGSCSK